jgi:hypothetical protein
MEVDSKNTIVDIYDASNTPLLSQTSVQLISHDVDDVVKYPIYKVLLNTSILNQDYHLDKIDYNNIYEHGWKTFDGYGPLLHAIPYYNINPDMNVYITLTSLSGDHLSDSKSLLLAIDDDKKVLVMEKEVDVEITPISECFKFFSWC